MEKLSNIQALRFFAALAVVGFHTIGHYQASGGGSLLNVFAYGWIGVDLFFVISGYIMWLTTEEQKGVTAALNFAYRRLIRVFSGYWPWLLVTLAIYLYFAPGRLDQKDILKSALLIPQPHSTNVLAVSWTLSYELLFYAGFALLLIFPRRYAPAILIAAAGIIGARHLLAGDADTFLMSPLILEFIGGALMARYRPPAGPGPLIGAAVASCALFAACALFVEPGDRMARTLTAGAGAVLVVYIAVALDQIGWSAGRALSALGDASYGLYLCHIPILTVIRWTVREEVAGFPALFYIAVMLLTVAISILWYRIYEAPAYRWLKRLPERASSIRLAKHAAEDVTGSGVG